MDNNLYRTLVEQFAIYDKSDLEEIINDKNASEEEIAAARYILSGKSPKANNYKEQREKQNRLLQEREDNIVSDPSYNGIHQIAGDIRFIRNIIIIGIIFQFINVIISLL